MDLNEIQNEINKFKDTETNEFKPTVIWNEIVLKTKKEINSEIVEATNIILKKERNQCF